MTGQCTSVSPAGSTKNQLIVAATRLLDEGGPDAVTLRAVAQAVGLSHNAPYKHFDGKRALLVAVAQGCFAEMTAGFAGIVQVEASPLRALKRVIDAYFGFARSHPARYRLLFSDPEIGAARGDLEVEALRTFDAVARLVGDAQGAGELRAGDTAKLTALIYGSIHGLADLELSGRARAAKGMADIGILPMILLDLLAVDPSV